jgi:hypothetical protein
MLIMVLVLAYVYMNETKMCRDWIKGFTGSDINDCKYSCEQKCELVYNPPIQMGVPGQQLNIPNLTGFVNKSKHLGE